MSGLSGLCPVAPTAEQPSLAKIISMAHNREEQSMPTGSTPMACPKAIHCLRSPPPDLVKLFQDQNLQDDMNRILQKQKPCHSNQTFVPHKKSQILGPYFVSHPPASLASIYPQPKEHLLPFQVKPDWNKWIGSFGAWPVWRKSEWTDWINRLNLLLVKFGGMQACLNLYNSPNADSPWTSRSLTGLPCTGEEISALLTLPPSVEYNAELKPSYPAFVRSAYDKSPTKEFIPLAVALAHGKQMALGPFLLAHLYRSCQDITAHPLVISGGPLWVLQLWLYSYFPALALVSSAVPARDLLTYGFIFKNAVENKRSFEECLKFFAFLSVERPDVDFVVFLGRSHGPSWYRADVRSPDFRASCPDKENTPTPVASPARHVHVDDIEVVLLVAADVPMIDDDLENELLAQLDMLMDTPAKSGSATDSQGKAVAEEVNFDINLPTQEQISFAIMTMQELLGGDPSYFCKVPDQPAAFEAAQILSRAPQLSSTQQKFWADFTSIYTHFSKRLWVLESKVVAADSVKKSVADSTAVVLKKKEEFLAAKEAHIMQVTHVQGQKEEISNLEAKLSELRNQVPLAEQSEKNLAEQRNKLHMDIPPTHFFEKIGDQAWDFVFLFLFLNPEIPSLCAGNSRSALLCLPRWLLLIVGDFWAYFLISRELPLEFSAECRRPLPPCSSGSCWKILVPDRSVS
ncbi:hypothetical protein SLEP1_g23489 [Rubroshorea leprosula]|uniref:Aminotransferase-like plant mobile domain-containing protein n=1 Tax=Rubroshorea leprosula TaxID=152421 RepID=A0AAV5JLC1_9ROSI|nr:hypothetical protein SLEP1_g23489 [Rubroshorea leprosula]